MHMSLPAANLGCVAHRLAEACEVARRTSDTRLGYLQEVKLAVAMCTALSTIAVHIATYSFVLCRVGSVMYNTLVAV